MEKSKLQEAIRVAFEHVPYPGDDNICPPSSLDDGEAVTRYFRGKDWRSLPFQLPHLCMWWMTPEACHYYLPAFLIGSLERDPNGLHLSEAYLDVIHRLEPRLSNDPNFPHDTEVRDTFLAIVALLSPSQKQVIRDFLAFNYAELQEEGEKDRRRDPDLKDPEFKDEAIERWDQSSKAFRTKYRTLIDYWNSI